MRNSGRTAQKAERPLSSTGVEPLFSAVFPYAIVPVQLGQRVAWGCIFE
jgi:hypothetical protein